MTVKQLIKVLITAVVNIEEVVLIDENRNEHIIKNLVDLEPYAEKEVVSFSKNPYTKNSFEIMIARH